MKFVLVCFVVFVVAGVGRIVAAESVVLDPIHVVAIENVCAWPNLTRMPDGTIMAIVHNKPSHGGMEGEIECWASDDGTVWQKRGNPAPAEAHTVRMNHAAGLAENGDLVVLCSGWTDITQPPRPKQASFRDDILRTWVCRSSDGGWTWSQSKAFPAREPGWSEHIPFGDIFAAEDGSLRTSTYQGKFRDETKSTKTGSWRSWQFRSDDDGRTWQAVNVIGPRHNETALFHAGGSRWLAAARIDAVELFASDDDGASWSGPQRVTERNEINAHLVRLSDRRLLMTYGNRVKGRFGVLAKFSSDEGRTWSSPVRLAHSASSDCGYPSSVQRADGKVVTAYYSKQSASCDHYHMGVVIWDPANLAPYRPSPVIKKITWAAKESITRLAKGSDNFPLTWADDDHLYTTWGDGNGFSGLPRRSMGFARIEGSPANHRGIDIRSEQETLGDGRRGKKGWGLLSVDGVLYLWMGHANQRGGESQLAWSDDHGRTWEFSKWKFAEFGLMGFVNFGRDHSDARDDYVYAYSHDGSLADSPADQFILMRVPKRKLADREAYEFLSGFDSDRQPRWSQNVADRSAVFEHSDSCLRSAMTWSPSLRRYLWWQQIPQPPGHKDRGDTRFDGGFGVYDAAEPWGPWTTAYITRQWDTGPGEHADFPAKWMEEDGSSAQLVFSGDDCFSVREASFELFNPPPQGE